MSRYQIMPDLSADEFEELKQDIAERGVLVPVEYDDQGNVLDGHHRIKACQELAITTWPTIIRQDFTDEEKHTYAQKLNLARRHLNQAQRRELIKARDYATDSDEHGWYALDLHHGTVAANTLII